MNDEKLKITFKPKQRYTFKRKSKFAPQASFTHNHQRPTLTKRVDTNFINEKSKFAPQASVMHTSTSHQQPTSIPRSRSNPDLKDERKPQPPTLDLNLDKLTDELTKRITSSLQAYIDTRMRYLIDQRLGLITNNDSITTRGVASFNIAEDYSSFGKSFLFKYNGQVVAKITSDGVLYCKMIWMNGINILDVINKVMNNIDSIDENFVRHEDLKNGTYELNVEDIITNTLTANAEVVDELTVLKQEKIESREEIPLTITNTKDAFPDGRYTIIKIDDKEIKHDRWNDSILINDLLEVVDWGNSWQTMLYSYSHFNYFLHNNAEVIIGKEDIQGDSIVLDWNFDSHDSSMNNLTLAFWDYSNLLQIFRDEIYNYVSTYVWGTNKHLYLKDGSMSNGQDKFVMFGKSESSTEGAIVNYHYTSSTFERYLELGLWNYRFLKLLYNLVKVDGAPLGVLNSSMSLMQSNYIYLGKELSNKMAAYIQYRLMTDSDSNYLSMGVYGNNDVLKIYKDNVSINGNTSIWGQLLKLIDWSLTAGNEVDFTFGKGTNTYEAGNLAYHLDSTLANSYITLYLNGMSGLRIYGDKTESITPFYCPSLYVGGTNVDVPHIAYTNVANTFTQHQTFSTISGTGNWSTTGTMDANIYYGNTSNISTINCSNLSVNGNTIDAANIAYRNVANTFTQPQEITTTGNSTFTLTDTASNGSAGIMFVVKTNANNERYLRLIGEGGTNDNETRFDFMISGSSMLYLYPNRVDIFTPTNINGVLKINKYGSDALIEAWNTSGDNYIRHGNSINDCVQFIYSNYGSGNVQEHFVMNVAGSAYWFMKFQWNNADPFIELFEKLKTGKPVFIDYNVNQPWGELLSLHDSALTQGNRIGIRLGKNNNPANQAFIDYFYYADDNDYNSLRFSLANYSDLLCIYKGSVAVNRTLTVNAVSNENLIEAYSNSFNNYHYLKVGRDYINCAYMRYLYRDSGNTALLQFGGIDNGNYRGYIECCPSYNDPYIQLGYRTYVSRSLTLQASTVAYIDLRTTGNDWGRIYFDEQTTNDGWLSIETHDDGTEPIYVKQICDYDASQSCTLTLLDSGHNSWFPRNVNIQGELFSFGDFITNGNISCNGDATFKQIVYVPYNVVYAQGFQPYSDARLKDNIKPINQSASVELIENINTYSFNYKTNEKKRFGMIAQEIKELAPDLVSETPDEHHYLTLDYLGLIPHLINTCQHLLKRVAELENIVNDLTNAGCRDIFHQ